MKNTTVTPTLESLIKQRTEDKGLSRSELVSAIGYSNISKGCKRLDTFLKTLEAPSEEFIIKITSVLQIDPVTFSRSLAASQDQFNADAKRIFTPHIQIKLGIRISPAFAAQMVFSKCSIPVPPSTLKMPLRDEIETITIHCKEHIADSLSDNITKHIIWFDYHREYNYFLRLDTDFTLEEIVFVQSMPSRKVPFGNRVVDVLLGGKG